MIKPHGHIAIECSVAAFGFNPAIAIFQIVAICIAFISSMTDIGTDTAIADGCTTASSKVAAICLDIGIEDDHALGIAIGIGMQIDMQLAIGRRYRRIDGHIALCLQRQRSLAARCAICRIIEDHALRRFHDWRIDRDIRYA